MGLISEMIGNRTSVELASCNVTKGKPMGLPFGVKSNDRVNRQELETDYRFDSVTFNIVNKQVELIMHAGFNITTKTARWQKWYDNFFDCIGYIGEETTKEELVEYIFQDMIMYGNSFVEKIYDSSDKKIVDLQMLPESQMDYAKDTKGNIALNEYGKPIGYVMKVPTGYSTKGLGDKVPKKYERKVRLQFQNQIFFLPKRIAHFKLHTYGRRFYGIGLIEPSHLSTLRKNKLEEAKANELYTRGSNTVIATVGDKDHEPTAQDIDDTLDNIANFKENRYFSFPYWIKVDTLPVQDSKMVDDALDYLITNQTAASGMPRAMATGEGETANKQTLETMNFVLELSLEHIMKKFTSAFKKFILKPIAKTNNIPEVADIKFGDIIAEGKDAKAERLTSYVRNGALAPEEIREYIAISEDVELDEKAYKKFRDSAKSKPKKLPAAPFPPESDGQDQQNNPSQITDKGETQISQNSKELSTVELGGFHMQSISKRGNPKGMTNESLLHRHQVLHVLWSKLEQGYQVGWTFEELHADHDEIVATMSERDIVHLAPINALDQISG